MRLFVVLACALACGSQHDASDSGTADAGICVSPNAGAYTLRWSFDTQEVKEEKGDLTPTSGGASFMMDAPCGFALALSPGSVQPLGWSTSATWTTPKKLSVAFLVFGAMPQRAVLLSHGPADKTGWAFTTDTSGAVHFQLTGADVAISRELLKPNAWNIILGTFTLYDHLLLSVNGTDAMGLITSPPTYTGPIVVGDSTNPAIAIDEVEVFGQ